MSGRILTLNCQRNMLDELGPFLKQITLQEHYDVLLLQEASASVLSHFDTFSHNYVPVMSLEQPEESEVRILVHKKHTILENVYESVHGGRGNMYGALAVHILLNGTEPLAVTSVHLPAGIFPKHVAKRMKGTKAIGNMMRAHFENIPALIAGDLNTGFPGEYAAASRILKRTFFTNMSDYLGNTIDSRFTHFDDRPFVSNLFKTLAQLNISIRLKLDHVYANAALLEKHRVSCSLLPDRVSDHSGIEITLQ